MCSPALLYVVSQVVSCFPAIFPLSGHTRAPCVRCMNKRLLFRGLPVGQIVVGRAGRGRHPGSNSFFGGDAGESTGNWRPRHAHLSPVILHYRYSQYDWDERHPAVYAWSLHAFRT
jgi:hypothetical protein